MPRSQGQQCSSVTGSIAVTTQEHQGKEVQVKRVEFIKYFKIHFSNMEKQILRPIAQSIKLLDNYE